MPELLELPELLKEQQGLVWGNERVIVVDKPPGWLSVPSRMGAQDERPCLGRVWEARLGCRLWPVHRLDVEVGGLVLFAKDAEAHRLLCEGFESHTVEKTYLAWTAGQGEPVLGQTETWRTRLLRGKKRAYVHPQGKEAVTVATALWRVQGFWLWRLQPRTGRPHQLRVELSRRGQPIVGDGLYGSGVPFGEGIALRAVRLSFEAVASRGSLGLPDAVGLSPATEGLVAFGKTWFASGTVQDAHVG